MFRETRNFRLVMIQLNQEYNCSTHVGMIRTRPQIATHKWAGPTKKCTGRWSWYTVHRNHLVTLITCKNQLSDTSPHSMLPNSGRVAREILLAPSGWKHRGKETVSATSFGSQRDYFVRPSCPCLWTRHTSLSIHNGRSLVTEEIKQKITTIPVFQTTTRSRLKNVTDKRRSAKTVHKALQ